MPIWIFQDPISFIKHVGHCLWEIPHLKHSGINWHVFLPSKLSTFLNLLGCKGHSLLRKSQNEDDFDTTQLQAPNPNACSSVILLTPASVLSPSAEASSKPCSSYGVKATYVPSAVSLCHSLLASSLSPRKEPLVFWVSVPLLYRYNPSRKQNYVFQSMSWLGMCSVGRILA